MRPPDFWQSRGWIAQMLRPLGAITALLTARRVARQGPDIGIPVICIGNINAGGTGKTPIVMAIAQRLIARGAAPYIVSRGYGGRQKGPMIVNPLQHTAAQVGDEPLLLATIAPTVVAWDRAAGARLAKAQGASVIVLDDGLQNPSLRKDLTICVVDAEIGFGNGFCLPAGPLREPIGAGLARSDIVLTVGEAAAQDKFTMTNATRIAPLPHVQAALKPLATGQDWAGARVVAFAGIGRPEKFFATLRAMGAQVLHAESLADHAPLPVALLDRLAAKAQGLGAELVTTEKDAVRLPARYRGAVVCLPVRADIADWQVIDAALAKIGIAAPSA